MLFIQEKFEKESANVAEPSTTDDSENVSLVASALSINFSEKQHAWVIDSGASQHMCFNKDSFSSFSDLKVPIKV